jgi:hypothetical protein
MPAMILLLAKQYHQIITSVGCGGTESSAFVTSQMPAINRLRAINRPALPYSSSVALDTTSRDTAAAEAMPGGHAMRQLWASRIETLGGHRVIDILVSLLSESQII